jgi:exosortase
MIPIPNTVATHLYLKTATAVAVEPLIALTGVPVHRTHTLFLLPDSRFLVSDACSGFATLYAATAIALLLACYCRSLPRRVVVLIAAVPLALAANVLRAFLLVVMAHFLGADLLDTPLHEASGAGVFCVVLGALILLAGRDTVREAFAS